MVAGGSLLTIRLRLHFFTLIILLMLVLFHCFIFLVQKNQICTEFFFTVLYRALLLDTTYFIIFLSLYSKSLMKLVVRSIPPWIPCNLAFTYEIIFIFFFTNFFPEFDHISPYTVILLTSILGFLEFMI